MQTTINYQCFAMTRGINIIAILVACTTAASAVLAPFPHGKTTVYNYRTTVKSTTSDDSLYASQFVLQGTLDITHDTRDPELANAYSVVLSNVVTDMHNGKTIDYDGKEVLRPIDGNANVIQAPFLIIYNPNGTFQALKVGENESEWSRNMKMAMAAMLQLDLPNINVKKLKNDNHSFVTQEKTIYGDCSVTYNLDSVYRASPNTPEEFRVSKDFSPIDCDGFGVQEFNNVDNDHCKAKKPEHMFTGSTRDFEFEQQAGGILIKKLNSYGVVRTIPANAAAYSHIVITNTTFEFLGVKEKSENDAQLGNFSDSQKIYDLTYRKPEASYVPNAAIDVTQGRHVVNVSSLPSKLEELLSEAFNYVEENHLSPNEIHWNHAQAINNILHTMRYMDEDGLQATFDRFEKPVLRRDIQMKNIFLGVVAQVGTPASCNFARNIILKNKISALSAVDMLTKLPLSVKVPTTRLLSQMEDLAKFDDAIPAEVRKAGILCFSSLVYRTFKNLPHPETSDILNKYLHDFLDHVENEPTYEMKVVYLMAIKNIQVGKIYHLLEPIINGTRVLTQDPERFLLLTIWAIDKAVEEDYTVATRILWPLMVNNTLSTKVRIAAYDILMNQAPDEKTARKVHEYVSTEGNEHFYNYHYTTLDSIARSVDQCKNDLRTIVKSILEETQYPRDADANIHYPLSSIYTTNYASFAFKYAEKIDIGVVVNEITGDPEVLNLEYETVDNDGSVSDLSIHMHIEGHHSVMKGLGHNPNHSLTATKILDILLKASSSVPARKKLKIDIVLMRNGRVLIANHYNYETLGYITRDLSKIIGNGAYNYQYMRFDRLYEKQLTSDIGVPIIVESRVPIVTSMQINFTNTDVRKTLTMDWDIELKRRTHGDYSMSVYNPMKDVWHVVRSVTATEVNLPLHTLITFHRAFKTLKMSFPKRLETTPSIAGILIRGKHLVTIDEEGTRKLMESCHICLNKENIPYLCLQEDGKMMKSSFDIKSLGLKFSSHMDIGEYGPLSERYSDYVATWDTTFMSKISNSWSDVLLKSIMDVRRVWKDITFTSQLRSRSYVLKLEPSSSYPISEINARLLGEYEDYDRNETTSELLHAKMYRNSVTFKTISSLTNKTAGMLNIDVKIHVNRGHLRNNVSVQITQKTPEEQKLKICIDAVKKFPVPPADYLKLTGTNEEIDSELTVYYGYTDGTECVLNETMISLTVKAELSDEQKMRFKEDLENSACSKETKSPLYASLNSSSVPRTVNCLNEAIRYTTPRKYTFDVKYEKLSLDFASFICDIYGIHEDLRENGNFQLRTQFPMTMNNIDLELMNNSSDFSTAVLPLKNLQPDGLGPVMKPLWDFPLDNSRFNIKFLHDYTDDRIRFCSVYPEIIHRGDGNKQPFTIPSDEWTLISGDYVDMKFAIFVKQTRPNYLSFQLFIKDHRVHFFTRESDNMLVAVGDGIEPGTTNGLQLPAEEHLSWRIKVKKANDHFVVRMWTVPLTLYIGSNYISIPLDSSFQGHVGGLCGHLSGSVFSNKSDIFSTNHID